MAGVSIRSHLIRLVAAAGALITLTACPSTTVQGVTRVAIIPPASTTLEVGATVRLTAAVQVTGDAPKSVTWESSDPEVASIGASSGELTANAPGTAQITATSTFDSSKRATIAVTVTISDSVVSVRIDPPAAAMLDVGESVGLTATVEVTGGSSRAVTWSSSDETVATIDESSGQLTAVAPGLTTVTATSSEDPTKSDAIEITVSGVVSVQIEEPASSVLDVGQVMTLTATVSAYGAAAGSGVVWQSSDPAIAGIVEGTGELTAHALGVVEITARSAVDAARSDTIQITVSGVQSVRIDPPASTTLNVGDGLALTATVDVTGSSSQAVTWSSSDEAVATIDESSGQLTAVAPGEVAITATSAENPTKSDGIEITVSGVVSVEIDQPASTTFDVGEDVTFGASVLGYGSAEGSGVTWVSSDAAVASIDLGSGLLTPLAPGLATITATSTADPSKSDTLEITVSGVRSVQVVPPPSTTLDVGQTVDLTADVVAFGIAADGVAWESSNSAVASIDGSGRLTASAPGTATITATSVADPTKSDAVDVTVRGVTSVQIEPPSSTTLTVGEALALTATVQVEGGAQQSVTWTSSQPDIAAVDETGLVSAYRPGVTEITATSTFDPTKADAVTLTIAGWTRQSGSDEQDRATALVVDTAGNSYVAGLTNGLLFGAAPNGLSDAFVVKYLPNGEVDWARQFGTARNESAFAVAVDGSGNVIVVGEAAGNLATGANEGHFTVFVRKYDPSGSELWTEQFSTGQHGRGLGVATDPTGNVVVVGRTLGDLEGPSAGGEDAFVRMYGPSGNELWTQQFGTDENDEATSVTIAGDAVFVAGTTDGAIEGTNAGGTDVFLARLDASANGSIGWAIQLGTGNGDYNHGVAIGADGKLVVAGNTYGSLQPGSPGAGDAYVATFEPADGSLIWLRQFGTLGVDVGYAVTTAPSGDIYLAGSTQGDLVGMNQGMTDAFVRRFDSAGSTVGTAQFGSTGAETLTGVAVDQHGNVIAAGYTTGDMEGTNAGGEDAFVSKLGL